MKKIIYWGIAIVVAIILYDLTLGYGIVYGLFPSSRGSLCGPICPPTGAMYWEKTCRGIVVPAQVFDSGEAYCVGFVMNDLRCYGILNEVGEVGTKYEVKYKLPD
jgi:hypothetical protein